MPDQKKIIDLRILNNHFTVVAEDEQYVQNIATFVNEKLQEILNKNPRTNHIQISMLGCMNIAEMLFEAQNEIVECEKLKREEIKRTNSIAEELETAQNKINTLNDTICQLNIEKDNLEKKISEKEDLLNQYREHLKQAKVESESNRKSILELQNQLFESQVELSKRKGK